jgi:hypothetical protein
MRRKLDDLPSMHMHTLSSISLHLRIHKKEIHYIEEGKQTLQGFYTSQDNKHNKLRKSNQFTMVVVWTEPNMDAISWTIPLM